MISFQKCIALITILINAHLGFSQQAEQPKGRKASICLSLNMLNMINDTYRFDLEGRKTNTHLSHILTGEFFNGNTYNDSGWGIAHENEISDDISGKGVGIYQKWFAFKKAREVNPYLCYGFGFRDISIRYQDEGYISYTQNSLEYYRYGDIEDVLKIKSMIYSVNGGLQLITPNELFVIDLFFGAAYKNSNTSSKYSGFRSYNNNPSNFAYSGWVAQVGFKLGLKFY